MTEPTELLPCPFCGAPAHDYAIAPHSYSPAVLRLVPDLPDHPGSYVIEGQCACGSGLIGANEAEVVARWNNRTPQPTQAQADAITPPPIECNTEELKKAYAFGWWSALEKQRETVQAGAVPLTDEQIKEVMDLVSDWGMQSHLRGEAELDAHNPEATEEEITYAKECAEKERAAWNAIKDKLKPHGIKGGQHGADN